MIQTFKLFATLHPKKNKKKQPWYLRFCVEYEKNMKSHYIEEVHAIKWCTYITQIPYILYLIIIQLQRQCPLLFCQFFKCQNVSPIHISHQKTAWWHSHQCIQCFKFQLTSTITLQPIRFGKSTFTYKCACQAKVVISIESKLQSWNCKSYWNLEVSTRVPI